ncbi:hypothetical protein MMC28_009789 [Mycoblastus sanguinarius]|nr:hypothetical protein [Mycoblastus sanguinarius]
MEIEGNRKGSRRNQPPKPQNKFSNTIQDQINPTYIYFIVSPNPANGEVLLTNGQHTCGIKFGDQATWNSRLGDYRLHNLSCKLHILAILLFVSLGGCWLHVLRFMMVFLVVKVANYSVWFRSIEIGVDQQVYFSSNAVDRIKLRVFGDHGYQPVPRTKDWFYALNPQNVALTIQLWDAYWQQHGMQIDYNIANGQQFHAWGPRFDSEQAVMDWFNGDWQGVQGVPNGTPRIH